MVHPCTVKNTVISPNFLVWKFCGKSQFPHSFRPKLCGNCAFPQNFHIRKLGEITAFLCSVDNQSTAIESDFAGIFRLMFRVSDVLKLVIAMAFKLKFHSKSDYYYKILSMTCLRKWLTRPSLVIKLFI